MSTLLRLAPALVGGTVVLVGLYDVVVGLLLLLSPEPWLAHGPGTRWHELAGPLAAAPADHPTIGLFRRMGAFSLHAGVVTIAWTVRARGQGPWMTALFATYLLTGLGFAWTDGTFFPGTPYATVKNAIGAAFVAAFGLHLAHRRAPPA